MFFMMRFLFKGFVRKGGFCKRVSRCWIFLKRGFCLRGLIFLLSWRFCVDKGVLEERWKLFMSCEMGGVFRVWLLVLVKAV